MAMTPQDDHGSSTGSRFECSSCPKTFPRACDLKKHTKFHERPVKCPYEDCEFHERGWSNEKELDRHINDRHTDSPQMYSCSYPGCNHKSKRESNLKQHEKNKHNIVHQRNRSSGSYVCSFVGCGQCRNELETRGRHGQPTESHIMGDYLADPQPVYQNPVKWQNASLDDSISPIPATALLASRNLAAVTLPAHPTPLAFPLLRSPDHNANLNSEVSRLHQVATSEHSTTAQGRAINAEQAGDPWNLAGAIRSVPPSVISTNFSGSYAVQGKGASSVDRNTTPTRKRKRGNDNTPEILGGGTSYAFDIGDGEDESVDGAAGDSEYDPSDSHRSPSLLPTEFNNSSRLQCPFKHVNPQVYSSLREPKYRQCEVERKPISQITRHLTRRHGLSVTKRCISSFDAPVFDGIHHPSASLCKNCWKTFSVRAESDSHFARPCPLEARKALSRPEKYKLLSDTFCIILPATDSSSGRSAVAQRSAHHPRRPSMLSHVSSAAAHAYIHDLQDIPSNDDQVTALQAQIASIDRRIEELDFEKSGLLRQVQDLMQAGGAPQDPLTMLESQPNSQATERDVLVGGMERPTECSDMASFTNDAELTLGQFDAEMDMLNEDMSLDQYFENT